MCETAADPRGKILETLLSALEAEARTEEPPLNKRDDWLYGSVRYTELELNQHGYRKPITPPVWMPRALLFWHVAIETGYPIVPELGNDPRHSLERWPDVERAVRAYLISSNCAGDQNGFASQS